LAFFLVCLVASITFAAPLTWQPEKWEDGSTLQIQTVDADRVEHWTTQWYVVIGGDIYVRLDAGAADLLEQNIKSPYVRVKIAGLTFSDVRADPADDMVNTVNEEMAYKYPLDILFRYMPHPMTVRLRAASIRF
jgi:hypothetical protein